ncbi:MAG: hypothetical protein AAF938_15795 [Myxococcota bacterium]
MGCAGASGLEGEDPVRYFQAGTDACTLAEEAIGDFANDGFVLRTRLRGDGFDAFDMVDDDGQTRLRIATTRGWALAVDAPSPEHMRPWIRLGPELVGGALVIMAPDAVRGLVCATRVRVEDGRAVERAVDFSAFGASGCATEVGASSVRARLFYDDLSVGIVPSLRVRLRNGSVLSADVVTEGDEPTQRNARAVEDAARAFLLGESADSQRQAFERGADCTGRLRWCEQVRARIAREWAREAPAAEAADAPADAE